jgi:hypothetical protein
MATTVDLYRSFRDSLRLSYRLVALTGNDINVGENFTMRFTVANQGPNPAPVDNPVIMFNNARVLVQATQFATPVAGSFVSLSVPDTQLFPGESSFVDIPMRALMNIGGIADWFSAEQVAKAWAFADVDLPQYFRIWQFTEVTQELEGT